MKVPIEGNVMSLCLLAWFSKQTLWNTPLTSVVNKQQHRLWIVGNGAMDDGGSNKLCTHLQHDHKNDKVDSSTAVISDLKQINNKKNFVTKIGCAQCKPLRMYNHQGNIVCSFSPKKEWKHFKLQVKLNFP